MLLEEGLGGLVEEEDAAVVVAQQQRGLQHLEQGLQLLADACGAARPLGVGGGQPGTVAAPRLAHPHQVGAEAAQPAFGRVVIAGIGVGHQARQLYLKMAQRGEQLALQQQADQEDGAATGEAARPQHQAGDALGLEEGVEPQREGGATEETDAAEQQPQADQPLAAGQALAAAGHQEASASSVLTLSTSAWVEKGLVT